MSSENTNQGKSRRDVMKKAGALAAGGALGSLAGCSGGGGGEGGGGSTETETEGSSGGSGDSTETSAGSKESVTISFFSARAAESSAHQEFFKKGINQWQQQQDNTQVDMTALGAGQLWQKVPSMAEAGNAPDIAQMGYRGLPFFFDDKTVSPEPFLKEWNMIDDLVDAMNEAMNFRGLYWAWGMQTVQIGMLTVRPSAMKSVGINDPDGLPENWTDYRRLLDKLHNQWADGNKLAYEESGDFGDLTSYWHKCYTTTKPGEDPLMYGLPHLNEGDYDPTKAQEFVRVGDQDKIDGMMRNTVDMALKYGSKQVAKRTGEEMPGLFLSNRLATRTGDSGRVGAYKSIDPNFKNAWDGDIYWTKLPKMDPNFGSEFGYSTLEGVEGNYGSHASTSELQITMFTAVEEKGERAVNKAADFSRFMNFSEDFTLPLAREVQTTQLPTKSLNKKFLNQYEGDMPQGQEKAFNLLEQYGDNMMSIGAPWDVRGTSDIRFFDVNKTISQTLAGQNEQGKTPGLVRDAVMKTLKERNEGFTVSG